MAVTKVQNPVEFANCDNCGTKLQYLWGDVRVTSQPDKWGSDIARVIDCIVCGIEIFVPEPPRDRRAK